MNCRLLRLPGAVKQPSSTHRSTEGRLSGVKVSFIASLLAFSLPVIAQPVDLSRSLVAEPAPPLQNKRNIQLIPTSAPKQTHQNLLSFKRPINLTIIVFILLVLWLGFLTSFLYYVFSIHTAEIRKLRIMYSKFRHVVMDDLYRERESLMDRFDEYLASRRIEPNALSIDHRFGEQLQALQKQADDSLRRITVLDPMPSFAPVPTQVDVQHSMSNLTPRSDLDVNLILFEFHSAYLRRDYAGLLAMASGRHLNITSDSEASLVKMHGFPTQLEAVNSGGSYLLIQRHDRNWLVPEFSVLTGFRTSKPAKGIFTYRPENVSTAKLLRPAEVKQVGGLWEVVTMGIIAVPS